MCLETEHKKIKKQLSGLNLPYHFTENLDYKGVELLVFMLGFTQNSFKNSPSNIIHHCFCCPPEADVFSSFIKY